MKISALTDTPLSINSEENVAVQLESLPPLLLKYLFWAAIISCFISSVVGIRAFGIVLFPLRVILMLALPFLLLNLRHLKKGIFRFASRLLILMLIYGIASLIWSPDPQLGFRSVTEYFSGLLFFLLVTRHAIDRSVLTKIMIIWSITIIVTSLLGVYEIVRQEYLFSFFQDMETGQDEIIATGLTQIGYVIPRVFWQNFNEFSFVNAISALVLIGWAFEARGVYRILALIATLLASILVIFSFSRAAGLGLLIGLMFFAFIYTIKSRTKPFYKILKIFLMISLGILLLYTGQKFIANYQPTSALMTKLEENSDDIRKYYYTTAIIQGTVNSCGFGRGLGASTEIIDGGSYHNYLVQILAELGFWVFLGYFILLAKICIQLWSAIRQGRNISWSCGLLASCIVFPLLCAGPASAGALTPYWLWLTFLVAFSEYDSILMRSNHKQFLQNSSVRGKIH